MTSEDFVRSFKSQKNEMLALYFSEHSGAVGAHIRSMRLSAEQTGIMQKLLDQALTDAFYSVLLALDGCARLGDAEQQSFLIEAEDGSLVCHGDGVVEGLAYKHFKEDDHVS
jgi:hypothetical protein